MSISNDNDLELQLQEIMQQNELLLKENELFMTYLQYNNYLNIEPSSSNSTTNSTDKSKKSLNLQQRHDISLKVNNKLTDDIKELEKTSSTELDSLKAVLEETEIRINELRKEIYDFNRALGGDDKIRTKNFSSDAIVKFFQEMLISKDSLIQKIQEKNNSLRLAINKLENSLKLKENQGDALHSIDFHQLQIENNQYNQKIKERNKELRTLKFTTGKILQVLNSAKKELSDLMVHCNTIQSSISDRSTTIERLNEEYNRVNSEVESVKKTNLKFKRQPTNTDMPQVIDYVNQKAREYELQQAVKSWERKVEIVEMGAKRARLILQKTGK